MMRCFLASLLFACLLACNESGGELFSKMPSSGTGITFSNELSENETANVLNYSYFYNGGGVAVGDLNNDGLQDIVFTGNMVPNRLYLNKGAMEFEDITEKSGIATLQGWCTGVTIMDINGDGYRDIYICRSADANPARRKNLLYINNGDLTFTESAEKFGLADAGYSTQAAFFDFDRDNDLDMFLINHSLQQYANEGIENPVIRRMEEPLFAARLYRNDGGRYSEISKQAGINSNVLTFGLGLTVADLDTDGWQDIYVSNDFNEPDYLFMNNGDGTFRESLAESMDEISLFSMGADAADYNNDGHIDLVTLDMLQEGNFGQKMHNGAENFDKFRMLYRNGFYYQASRNMLHKNNGDGTFSELGQYAGIAATDWSWSALFADFDNDGHKDLFVSNGYLRDYTNMDFIKYTMDKTIRERAGAEKEPATQYISRMPSIVVPNYIFRNTGDRFEKYNYKWGINEASVAAGAAYADFDNDGDLDLVINNTNEAAAIYKNNSTSAAFLRVSLTGPATNRDGVGVRLTAHCNNEIFTVEQSPVRGFQSAVDPVVHFGLGSHRIIDSLVVVWPDRRKQVLKKITGQQTIKVAWKNADELAVVAKSAIQSLFIADTSVKFLHRENEFNDFTLQSLLPHYYSREGPALAHADINGDGLDDLFAGSASGSPSQIFIQQGNGTFQRTVQRAFEKHSASEDVSATFFDADGDGDQDLYVCTGAYELQDTDQALLDRLYINDGNGAFTCSEAALPVIFSAGSCVKAHDFDGDGHVDLFVGGRIVPGKYPLTPRSYVLHNNGNGTFEDVTLQVAPSVAEIGMVTDAVWVDVNADDSKDLVVVGEWMPVSILINRQGKLVEATNEFINFPSRGWWQSIAAADFDGDGDEDIIIGNIGENTIFRVDSLKPLTVHAKDFDNNGSIDPLLCYFVDGISYPVASRDDLTEQLPLLRKKFLTYDSYAGAKITDVFSDHELRDAKHLEANCMSTVLLENRGKEGLKLRPLPAEAQYSPVFGIALSDVNGDGQTDVVLAGNNTWSRVKFGRYRANHGTVLLSSGRGHFKTAPQNLSGLKLRGDVRGLQFVNTSRAKLLLAANNNDSLRVYRVR